MRKAAQRQEATGDDVVSGPSSSGVHPVAERAPEAVLLVDDHEDVRFVIAELLRAAGLRVVTASSGREALVALGAVRPDLVLTDVCMPEMSGIELTETIRTRESLDGVPVILMSAAYDEDALLVSARRLGCPLVSKNLAAPESLLEAVRSALRREAAAV